MQMTVGRRQGGQRFAGRETDRQLKLDVPEASADPSYSEIGVEKGQVAIPTLALPSNFEVTAQRPSSSFMGVFAL